ncbi:hypothetical protein JXA05_04065 [Candidatus Peregrinibacteria bacterium]|nr:hypothetical protein [Candidatus Peregrinibacteria bacterium]
MENTNRLIRHELLNLLMEIQIALLDGPLSREKRKELLGVVERAALLTSYQNMMLGKKQALFVREVDLRSLLEIIILTHKNEITKKSVTVILPKGDLSVRGDETLIKLAIEQVTKALLEKTSAIEFKWAPQKKTLTIQADRKAMPALAKKDWSKCLKNENPHELGLQLAVRALEAHKIRWETKGQQLHLIFR